MDVKCVNIFEKLINNKYVTSQAIVIRKKWQDLENITKVNMLIVCSQTRFKNSGTTYVPKHYQKLLWSPKQ